MIRTPLLTFEDRFNPSLYQALVMRRFKLYPVCINSRPKTYSLTADLLAINTFFSSTTFSSSEYSIQLTTADGWINTS